MDIWKITIAIFVILICFACLYYMSLFREKANVERVIDEASKRAEYTPTLFKIYDKSSDNVCDRLIVIAPFDWYLWAVRGELYILNPEGGIKCAQNTTPAIQVLADQFLETCLKLDLNSILDVYVNGKVPHVVSYEINETTFTILSAINILVRNYIYFDISTSASPSTNGGILNRLKLKHLEDGDDDDKSNIDGGDDDDAKTKTNANHSRTKRSLNDKIRNGRLLSGKDVINVTTTRGHSDLYKYYRLHTSEMS